MTAGSCTVAISRSRPPQCGHARTSIANVPCINAAQSQPRGRLFSPGPTGPGAISTADAVGSGTTLWEPDLARGIGQGDAEVEALRYAEVLKRGLIAREQAEQFRTTAESLTHTVRADEADIKSAEETVRADEAAVDNAEIQLDYTTLRSPIDGRTGSLMLHEGNIVRAGGSGDSTLVVINQIQPIYVSFTVPRQQLPEIKRYMAEGTLETRALPAGDPEPLKGTVSFIDNAVDQATGTIRLKATFANQDKLSGRLSSPTSCRRSPSSQTSSWCRRPRSRAASRASTSSSSRPIPPWRSAA